MTETYMDQQAASSVVSTIIPALIGIKEIRKHYLPLASRTLFRMIASGKFPKADLSEGRKIRLWKRETVEAWIDQNTHRNSTADYPAT